MTPNNNRAVLDEKYAVQRLVPDGEGGFSEHPLAPGTYFVLRSKDLFATGTLRAYAAAIMTFLESANMAGVVVDEEVLARMEHLLNYATSLAEGWEGTTKQVPD